MNTKNKSGAKYSEDEVVLNRKQIDDMAFGYCPSGKIGELHIFARAIEREVLATRASVDLSGLLRYDYDYLSGGMEEEKEGDYFMVEDVQRLLSTKEVQPKAMAWG